MENNVLELIIAGSGPAGLTAAIYGARFGLSPLLLEGVLPGGQLMKTTFIENWPGEKKILGAELMGKIREHAAVFGARFLNANISSFAKKGALVVVTTDTGKQLLCRALIIATGSVPRRLGCPGEDEYWGKGVSSCAVCDGALYKDRPVVVVGGGNSALENALFLRRFTNRITLIHLFSELTASEERLKRAVLDDKNIAVRYESSVSAIKGKDGRVVAIEVADQRSGEKEELQADAAFIAIGQVPNTRFVPPELKLKQSGHVLVKECTTETSVEAVFAAGDVADARYCQAITAAAMGCMSALDVQKYLKKSVHSLN
ncbi:MAG: FAD-dependent oxidoreductase [Candidatus Babeliaceae bacterium]|nr:FAD-dependent oxidoreductase [Candidatus Babeliaceae bacterium]